MDLKPNARTILEKRYLQKENGVPVETPEDMFLRVARAVAAAENIFQPEISKDKVKDIEDKFYNLMTSFDFMPNSPTLMNAGRDLGQLSACFVIPIDDSMNDIFTALKDAALIHKSGGGTGFTFSRLRPKNSLVKSTGGLASGPISFMKVFNAATEAIRQGGVRRGANMGILRVDHPDILEFINAKQNNNDLTNFNLSVGLTRDFMEALDNDGYYDLKFDSKVYDRLRAREVMDLIVERAWTNGEPGIVFLDRLNEDNPTPDLGEIEATNPCGEQPLLGYEACNLGSINLSNMVDDGKIFWEKLADTVRWSVRFLDNVIEVNNLPLPQISEMVRGNRKIGLGIMGWADMLFKLQVPYDSDEAVELAKKVMGYVQEVARDTSHQLGEERGSFPNIEQSIFQNQIVRNATCTTIAPTGTISMIAGTTSGIEPVFSLAYTKNVLDGAALLEVDSVFEDYVRLNFPPEEAETILQQVAQTGRLQQVSSVPAPMYRVFITALEVSPIWHIKMQAAFQAYCDNAVSKTVNFPVTATRQEVAEVFRLAYQLGCKGVTVYRSGSREEEVLLSGNQKPGTLEGQKLENKTYPRPRPKRTIGVTEQVKTGCGKMYITVNSDQEGIIETFITTGSTGGCSGFTEGVSRLISLALRANIAPEAIIDQLTSVSCPNFLRKKATNKYLVGKSCPDIIGKVLTDELTAQSKKTTEEIVSLIEQTIQEIGATVGSNCLNESTEEIIETDLIRQGLCPECRSPLHFAEGCLTCICGYSKCS